MKKKIITTPFDRNMEPPRQNPAFALLIWILSWFMTRGGQLKIHKKRMDGLKPPFLVLGNHQSFMDFYVAPLALFPHRANYVSEIESFENYGEWLNRQAGCLGTRKFVNDLMLVKNIKRIIKRKDILVIFPEARYANVGTDSRLPESVGKLAKHLDVPLVIINMKGNYLNSPIWNVKKRKGVPLEATITQLFTRDELRAASACEVNAQIKKAMEYDEYAWQKEKGIRIDEAWRAEGLELVLYQCPQCNAEFEMQTQGDELFCSSCHAMWRMTEFGELESKADTKFSHIPDWYEWQRGNVNKEIDENKYHFDSRVRIESLPNAKNFIDLGEGRLVHRKDGFSLTFTEYGEVQKKTIDFIAAETFSIHTEYNYRGKGQCITLSTVDNTYFIYPLEHGFNATKLQFATEYMHRSVNGNS